MQETTLAKTVIVAARVLLVAVAASALIFGLYAATQEPRGLDPGGSYACPMHPEVNSSSPGDCPICRMALELRKVQPAPTVGSLEGAPTTVELPAGAEIRAFDQIGYGKMFEQIHEMRAHAWAETREVGRALLYRDEIALLEPKEGGDFYPSGSPTQAIPRRVEVTRVDEPPTPWDYATALVRFKIAGKGSLLPGQTGSVKFRTRVRDVLSVRAGAVIQSPTGPYVLLVARDNRTLTRRSIQIGSTFAGHASVISGLAVGERVAVLNTFFLDAERRFSGRAVQ